jgi:predicted GIY-YIG superfamily endonuclease
MPALISDRRIYEHSTWRPQKFTQRHSMEVCPSTFDDLTAAKQRESQIKKKMKSRKIHRSSNRFNLLKLLHPPIIPF